MVGNNIKISFDLILKSESQSNGMEKFFFEKIMEWEVIDNKSGVNDDVK